MPGADAMFPQVDAANQCPAAAAAGRALARESVVPRRTATTTPLVNWDESPPQVRVLDWRRRAKDYGLAPGEGREDGDLVRKYLREVGRRPLLTKAEEAAIGQRIEANRADLAAALSGLPSAIHTLTALASLVESGQAPAAELVLLPDGGELDARRVAPVLRAIRRADRLRAWSCLSTVPRAGADDKLSRRA